MVKKVPAVKIVQNEGTEDKPKDNSDPSSAAVVEGTSVKTTVEKKIIKRIAKKRSLVWNPVMGFLELRKTLMGMK